MPLLGRRLQVAWAFAGLAAMLPVATLLGEFGLRGTLGAHVPGSPSLGFLPFAAVSGQVTALGEVFTSTRDSRLRVHR